MVGMVWSFAASVASCVRLFRTVDEGISRDAEHSQAHRLVKTGVFGSGASCSRGAGKGPARATVLCQISLDSLNVSPGARRVPGSREVTRRGGQLFFAASRPATSARIALMSSGLSMHGLWTLLTNSRDRAEKVPPVMNTMRLAIAGWTRAASRRGPCRSFRACADRRGRRRKRRPARPRERPALERRSSRPWLRARPKACS